MANLVYTVNTDGGGNYSSLSLAEAALNQDLTDNGGDTLTINCSGTTADTAAVTFDGWAVNNTYYINIVGDWDGTKYDTTKYRLEVTTGLAFLAYRGFHMQQIQMKMDNDPGFTIGVYSSSETRIDRCIIWSSSDTYARVFQGSDIANLYISNTIFYGAALNECLYLVSEGTGTVYIENCTIAGSATNNITTGIYAAAGCAVTIINTIFRDCVTDLSGTATNTYCSTDNDNTKGLTAAGEGNRFSQTFTFISTAPATTGFLHLAANDTGALDLGTSSVNGGFTTDIDGITRAGTWDIGADEYVAALYVAVVPVASSKEGNTSNKIYSRGSFYNLPTDDGELTTQYSSDDYTTVSTDDGTYVNQEGI